MAGPIGTIPQGLLGLLQLKELGVNPSQLMGAVQPNLDITPLYLQRNMVNETNLFGGNISTVGLATAAHGVQGLFTAGAVQASVPNNEMWYVYQFCLNVGTLPAADSIIAAPAMQTLLGQVILLAPVQADVVTARARSWATGPITPLFVPPGANFMCFVADVVSGTTIGVQAEVRAVRIPI